MSHKDHIALQVVKKSRLDLAKDLKIDSSSMVLIKLESDGYFNSHHVELITSEKTNAARVSKLLDLLNTRLNQKAFVDFVNAIEQEDANPGLANALREKYEAERNRRGIPAGGPSQSLPTAESTHSLNELESRIQSQRLSEPTVFYSGSTPNVNAPEAPVPTKSLSSSISSGVDTTDALLADAPMVSPVSTDFCFACVNNNYLLLTCDRRTVVMGNCSVGRHVKHFVLPASERPLDDVLSLDGAKTLLGRSGSLLLLLRTSTEALEPKAPDGCTQFPLRAEARLDCSALDGTPCCVAACRAGLVLFVGTDAGAVGAVVVDAGPPAALRLIQECHDDPEPLLGFVLAPDSDALAAWRADGAVETGGCGAAGYLRRRQHRFGAKGTRAVSCAFLGGAERLGVALRGPDGRLAAAVWDVAEDRVLAGPQELSERMTGRAEAAGAGQDLVVATGAGVVRLRAAQDYCATSAAKPWPTGQSQWFRALQDGSQWLVCGADGRPAIQSV